MELELKDYAKILKKRIWLIAVCVIIACTTTAVVSFYFMKPVYEASTKLIVSKSDDNESLIQQLKSEIDANILLIATYKEVIKTTAIMDKVVEQHPEFNLTAEELIEKVKVSSVNNTQVMTLTVEDYSYEKAMNIVNAVSKVFKESIPTIMKVDNVEILNEAKMPENPSPVKPNPILNIIISFIVSLMFSVGIAFLLEYLDDTIKTEEDIAAVLGVPTFAVIAAIKDRDISTKTEKTVERKVGEAPYATVNR